MTTVPTPRLTIGPLSIDRQRLLAITALSTAAVIILYICAPPIAPGVLVACLLPPVVWTIADHKQALPFHLPGLVTDRIAVFIFAFVVWMALSNVWSPNPRVGMAAASWSFAILGIVYAVTSLAPRVASDARTTMALAFAAAFSIGVVLLLWDALTDLSGRRLFMNLIPPLKSRSSDAVIRDGAVIALPLYLIKKNAAVVMMLFWPALLIAVRYATTAWQKRAVAVAVALFALAIFVSGHDTSRVALAASGAIWMLAMLKPSIALRAAQAIWLVAVLAIVPLAHAAYNADLHKASYIQFSGRHRIVIWERTAENVMKAPIRGAGIAATRYIDEIQADRTDHALVPGTDIPDGTNVHSHNVFLQTWHELGAVGALLLAAAGLPLIGWIGRRATQDQPYLIAAFATAATIASLSWSMIAAWFVATFGLVVIFAQLAALASEDAAKRTAA